MKPRATIDRFEGEKAILILEDGQKLVVAKESLAPNAKEGDMVDFNFSLNEKARSKKRIKIKKIIKQIFKKQKC